MLDAVELANKLHGNIIPKIGADGAPLPVSTESQTYAAGVIAALKSAIVSNLPGTINGITAPGSPLSAGSGIGGLIVMTPAPMIAVTTGGFNPLSGPDLLKENTAIVTYIATGLVTFAPGNITGQCTSSPTSPGPLANGAGTGGKITALTGAGAFAAVFAALGFLGPDALNHYTILINYILDKAEVTYASGSVTGVCPPGGGPLGGGAATGGTIS